MGAPELLKMYEIEGFASFWDVDWGAVGSRTIENVLNSTGLLDLGCGVGPLVAPEILKMHQTPRSCIVLGCRLGRRWLQSC